MLIVLVAFLGGVLTILSPCILPILPFVFARADRPFRSHGLPMLLGMAFAFSVVATLAAVGGGWATTLNDYGRYAAIALLAVFGATLLSPRLAEWISRPLVSLGNKLSETQFTIPTKRASILAPAMLGVGTGLLWAPCAGPILGLILTGAALNGANIGTSLLLLTYAAGACTSLAVALMFGGRLQRALQGSLQTGEWIRRATGVAVLVGVGAISLGADTKVLTPLSGASTSGVEELLLKRIQPKRAMLSRSDAKAVVVDASEFVPTALHETTSPDSLPVEGDFPGFAGATEWINSPPLTAESLRGKVVLIDFWTYSCINCLRTLPYVRAWAQKYKDSGLVVVGVHAPEFAFEKNSANVHQAVKDLGIDFPVAMDSNFKIWRSFENQYWPAFYFIDAQGRIRHHRFGEEQYERGEEVIQQLLLEAGAHPVAPGLVKVNGVGTEAAPGHTPPLSQESYLGYAQATGFASPAELFKDRPHLYQAADSLRRDQWSLGGDWTVERERVVLNSPNGRIALRFHARDLHLVLGAAANGRPVRFKVLIDGKPPLGGHGYDVDEQGNGKIDAQRLYQLVRQSSDKDDRLFEIEFIDPGAQAFVFTFG